MWRSMPLMGARLLCRRRGPSASTRRRWLAGVGAVPAAVAGGLTGGTVMATLAGEPAATGRGADDPVATAAAALAALAEEPAVAAAAGGDGGGAPSPLQISPPSGWLLADDGRYMPPPHLSHTAPQATVVAAWAMHRQMARLATNMVGTSGFAVARTRHGV